MSGTQFLNNVSRTNAGFVAVLSQKTKQGHVGNRRLKIVCEQCNTGWMKRDIEDKSKPLLSPLLVGTDCIIDKNAQEIISDWAILKTIVAEYTDITNKSIKADERTDFYHYRNKAGWVVLIGRLDNKENDLRYHHAGITYNTPKIQDSNGHAYLKFPPPTSARNAQYSIFIIGQLLIYTYKTSENVAFQFANDDVVKKLCLIHPVGNVISKWQDVELLNESDFEHLKSNHHTLGDAITM